MWHVLRPYQILADVQKLAVLRKPTPINEMKSTQADVVVRKIDDVVILLTSALLGCCALQYLSKALGCAEVAQGDDSTRFAATTTRKLHAALLTESGGEVVVAVLNAAQGKAFHLDPQRMDDKRIRVDLVAQVVLAAATGKEQLAEAWNRVTDEGLGFRNVLEGNRQLSCDWVDHDHCLPPVGKRDQAGRHAPWRNDRIHLLPVVIVVVVVVVALVMVLVSSSLDVTLVVVRSGSGSGISCTSACRRRRRCGQARAHLVRSVRLTLRRRRGNRRWQWVLLMHDDVDAWCAIRAV